MLNHFRTYDMEETREIQRYVLSHALRKPFGKSRAIQFHELSQLRHQRLNLVLHRGKLRRFSETGILHAIVNTKSLRQQITTPS